SGVRNREDLAIAVRQSLKRLKALKGYVICTINDDRLTTSTYIYDNITMPENEDLSEMLDFQYLINDGLHDRVLASPVPIFINIDSEVDRGITANYICFWKSMGFTKAIAVALRNWNTELGILWIAIEAIDLTLVDRV